MVVKWFKDFWLGLSSFIPGTELIFKKNLWYYFLFPTIFLVALLIEKDILYEEIRTVRFDKLPEDNWDFQVLIVSVKAIGYFAFKHLYKNIILILAVPFLSMLSVAIEKSLTGNKYPFNFKQFIADIRRGSNVAATNLVVQMLIVAGWFLLTLIYSPLEAATPYVVFCVGFYFYGFSFMDYTSERRRLSISESINFIRAHSGMAIAIGAVFSSIFLIPYAGVVIAPIVSVSAATVAVHKLVDLRKNKFAKRDDRGNIRKTTDSGNKALS